MTPLQYLLTLTIGLAFAGMLLLQYKRGVETGDPFGGPLSDDWKAPK